MGADRVSPSKMLKYLVLLFVVATVFGEPEPSAVADAAPKADADPWYYYGGYPYAHYGYYGYPYAHYWAGRKRRSAEPEPAADANPKADTYYYYRGYYGHPYRYGFYGHGGYLWGRKRRSAERDAEPAADAKADPWYLYGGYYGHGYGLGYAHYGYPYGYAYWGSGLSKQNINEMPKVIVNHKLSASSANTTQQRRPLQPHWTCLCSQSA